MSIGNIKMLSLRHNQISDISPLEKLYSLVQLDISHNLIGSVNQVKYLKNLPFLISLWLENNPIDTLDSYRWKILKIFVTRNDIQQV